MNDAAKRTKVVFRMLLHHEYSESRHFLHSKLIIFVQGDVPHCAMP